MPGAEVEVHFEEADEEGGEDDDGAGGEVGEAAAEDGLVEKDVGVTGVSEQVGNEACPGARRLACRRPNG